MSSVGGTKAAVLVLIGIIPFCLALLPWLIQIIITRGCCCRGKNGVQVAENILNYLNFVAGGIFLGLILLHMIPESSEEMGEALEDYGIHTHYPVGAFLVGVGLVAFVVVEQVVMYCRRDEGQPNSVLDSERTEETGLLDSGPPSGLTKKTFHRSYDSIASFHETEFRTQDGSLSNPKRPNALLRTYALLIALSLHSIFEGMMIGFQTTESVLWGLFVAIIFHKVLVAFSLGSRLLKSMQLISLKHFFGLILVFCVMAPLGGLVAALLADFSQSPALKLTENILSALATGSFMFVTFFEILKFDCDAKVNLFSVFCLILGFGVYALEMYLEGDSGHAH